VRLWFLGEVGRSISGPMGRHTNSGLGGFMSGASIRFSKMRGGSGGADAWRDSLMLAKNASNGSRPKTTGTKLPELHSVHRGTVVSVQPFGAFVQLGNGEEYKDGLVHISCISAAERPERVEDYLSMGDTVWVKVMEVKEEDLKYSLDMRYVNQKDGTPLYKNNRDDTARASRKTSVGSSTAAQNGHCNAGASLAVASPMQSSEACPRSERRLEEAPQQPLPDDSESSDSEQQKKVQKKLQKAAKKLEKVRRKAEKVKKKLKKKEKRAKASGSSGSQDSSQGS